MTIEARDGIEPPLELCRLLPFHLATAPKKREAQPPVDIQIHESVDKQASGCDP